MTQKNFYKTETDLQTQRTGLWLPRGKQGGGGMDWEFEVNKCKLLHIYLCIYVCMYVCVYIYMYTCKTITLLYCKFNTTL